MRRAMTDNDRARFLARLSGYIGLSVDEMLSSPPVPPTPPACPVCGDLGYVTYQVNPDHPMFGRLQPCPAPRCSAAAANRTAAAGRLLNRSGLPTRYAALTFETWFEQPDAARAGKHLATAAAWSAVAGELYSLASAAAVLELAGSYSPELRGWLVLSGPMGVGKTGLAAAVVNERAARGLDTLFYRAADLFADIQGRYGRDDGPSADDLLDQVKHAALLILDELNVPQPSADKQRIVEELIRYRHGRDLPTIITTNLNPSEFTTMWGGRTSDVVMENAHWLTLSGPKLRRSTTAIEGD